MQRALILAAGRGERLVSGFDFPKPLKRVMGVPLVHRILNNLLSVGVKEVAVVCGYMGDTLERAMRRFRSDMTLHFIYNNEWDKPNGNSVLSAREFITEPTLLMMCDHLWSPDLLLRVSAFPLQQSESVLGVDYDIDACFDLPDATKVNVQGQRVVEIGKNLEDYEALDTGVFKITPALVEALMGVDHPEHGCSLSQGVACLAEEGLMRAVDVGDAVWVDVDTPGAHAHAESLIRRFGNHLHMPTRGEAVASVG